MKKIIGFIFAGALMCALGVSCDKEDGLGTDMTRFLEQGEGWTRGGFYYYYHAEKIPLTLNTKHAFLSLREPRLPDDLARIGGATEFLEDKTDDRYYTKLTFENRLSETQYMELLAGIKAMHPQIIVQPYFGDGDREGVGASNIFYVELKKNDDTSSLEQAVRQIDCEIVEEIAYIPGWYIIRVTEATPYYSVECSTLLYETGLFENIDPAFMFDFAPGK